MDQWMNEWMNEGNLSLRYTVCLALSNTELVLWSVLECSSYLKLNCFHCFHLEHLLWLSFLAGYNIFLLPLPNVHIKHTCVCNPLCCSMPLSPPYESLSAQSHQNYNTNIFQVPKITKSYSKPLPSNYHSSPMLLITLKGSFLIWLEITFLHFL